MEEWGHNTKQQVHESQTQIILFQQQVRGVILSAKYCFIDLLSEILDGVSVGHAFHHPRQRCHGNREMVILGSLFKRDLESVQEEDFLLPCVLKCVIAGWHEGLVLLKCSKIKVNDNI